MDRVGIAARVRALLATEDSDDVVELARRLNVGEVSLRMTVDELSPHPTIEVLTAIVSYYGADPSWVLTGEYDAGQHRRALEGSPAAIESTVRELASPRATPAQIHFDVEPAGDSHAEEGRNRPTRSGD